jgi:hypothetical protein
MTSATMKMVTINVNIPASEAAPPTPKQHLDDGEFIVTRVVELDELQESIRGMSDPTFY